jgi:iron complex transport system substrate-binding protein
MQLLAGLILITSLQVAVQDDYGHRVALPAPAQRIVSLSPHLTELLYAAGAGDKVVGAVDYSDYPPKASKLPRVGGDAGIDLEAVLALRPDLVVAWPNAGSVRSVNRLAELGIPTFRSEPRELEDIPRTIERLGILAGTSSESAGEFRRRVAELERRYSKRPTVRVFYQVWDRPLQTVNGHHVISKVIRLCGGINVFEALPAIAPEIDREALLRARPEVTITSIRNVPAPAHFIPGELIQRHTPRLLDGAERLCRILEGTRTAR